MNTAIEKKAIQELIIAYSDAFNATDASKTVELYTEDGVLMPNDAPLATGQAQIKATFEFLFKTFQINIKYVIDEVIVSGDYAYARTNSTVKTIIKSNGETILLENKELFVLHKEGGRWKIARYIFNNTKSSKR